MLTISPSAAPLLVTVMSRATILLPGLNTSCWPKRVGRVRRSRKERMPPVCDVDVALDELVADGEPVGEFHPRPSAARRSPAVRGTHANPSGGHLHDQPGQVVPLNSAAFTGSATGIGPRKPSIRARRAA